MATEPCDLPCVCPNQRFCARRREARPGQSASTDQRTPPKYVTVTRRWCKVSSLNASRAGGGGSANPRRTQPGQGSLRRGMLHLRRHGHSILPLTFGDVQGRIGRPQQRLGVGAVLGKCGHADRDGDRTDHLVLVRDAKLFHRFSDLLRAARGGPPTGSPARSCWARTAPRPDRPRSRRRTVHPARRSRREHGGGPGQVRFPRPRTPSGVLGRPQWRPDGAPPLGACLLPATGPALRSRDHVRWLE